MKWQANRWLVSACVAVAFGAIAPSAHACRAVRPLTEAEVRERSVLFTATVASLNRTPDSDGERIRAVLRPERLIYGEPGPVVIAEDHVRTDGEIMVYCGGRRWVGDELTQLSEGDEVVVSGWRRPSGETIVTDLGRIGGTRARLLLNAPHP